MNTWHSATWGLFLISFLIVPLVFIIVNSFNGGISHRVWDELNREPVVSKWASSYFSSGKWELYPLTCHQPWVSWWHLGLCAQLGTAPSGLFGTGHPGESWGCWWGWLCQTMLLSFLEEGAFCAATSLNISGRGGLERGKAYALCPLLNIFILIRFSYTLNMREKLLLRALPNTSTGLMSSWGQVCRGRKAERQVSA